MTGKLQIGNVADRYGRRIKKGIHSTISSFIGWTIDCCPVCRAVFNAQIILFYIFPKRILTMHACDGFPCEKKS